MLLFGHGDGGGGPAISHLEQLLRLQNCEGLPRVHVDTAPDTFFSNIAEDFQVSVARGLSPPRWVGELYLELHQGTFTSQARIKKQNRACEALLRACDALLSIVLISHCNGRRECDGDDQRDKEVDAGKAEVKRLWKDLLLNQFHDVIRECRCTLQGEGGSSRCSARAPSLNTSLSVSVTFQLGAA